MITTGPQTVTCQLCVYLCVVTSGSGRHVCHLLKSIQEGSGHHDGRSETNNMCYLSC